MSRPVLLDLFCGAGGAATGYHRAGFDVVGVDIRPQPRYPFEFVRADAMAYPLDGVDAIHASPPCQDFTRTWMAARHGTGWMLPAARERLAAAGAPWVIENVPGAPVRPDYKLCGCMFGLPRLKRERWFETSWGGFEMRAPCHHPDRIVSVVGMGIPSHSSYYRRVSKAEFYRLGREAMGIGWMSRAELCQAIPPDYTEHIGRQLMEHLTAVTA